ncbi:MAG: putative zinc protease [Myxococcota bacterium]|nr:putative zinc protease [Myxococcota bacterium]
MGEFRVLCESSRGLPNAVFQIAFARGAADDPPGKAGAHHLLASLMMRGTKKRSRREFRLALDHLGSTLYGQTDYHYLSLVGESLTPHLEATLELTAECLFEASLDAGEFESLMREAVGDRLATRDEDEELVVEFFRDALFSSHPYGRIVGGDLHSLARIDLEDLKTVRDRLLTAPLVIAAAGGDVDQEQWTRLLEKYFPRLTALNLPEPWTMPEAPRSGGMRLVIVDKPERSQTQLVMGHLGLAASHPDRLALAVAINIFGGTFTSRYTQEIREKRGWSYGAHCTLSSNRGADSLAMFAFPQNQVAVDAVLESVRLYQHFTAGGVTEEELDFARNYLINRYPLSVETAEQRVFRKGSGMILGLPDNFEDTYLERLRGLELDEVNRAVRQWCRPGELVIAAVGDPDILLPIADRLPGVVQVSVIPFDIR